MAAEIPKLKGSKNPWLSGLQQYFQYDLSISIHLKGENPDSNRYKQQNIIKLMGKGNVKCLQRKNPILFLGELMRS